MLMEMKNLLQLGDGQSWQSCRVLGRGRVGCARRWTLRVAVNAGLPHNGRVRLVVAHAGAACAHVQCLELCCVRTGCVVGCSALLVRALRVGDVQVGSADGRARHGRVDRARWSRAPPGVAQSAALFGTLLFPKSLFFQYKIKRNRSLFAFDRTGLANW